MKLPVTAFFQRSLREGMRQPSTYFARGLLLSALIGMLAVVHAVGTRMGAPGREVFMGVAWTDLVLILASAPGLFALVIQEERAAGTLGLLKMTGLSPASILVGKCGGLLLNAVTLLLVQVPVVVLAVTLGGVSLRQVFAGYLAMLAFLVCVASVGMLLSVLGRGAVVVAIFCIGASYTLVSLRGMDLAFLTVFSPFHRVLAVMQTGFSGPLVGFQFWSNLALAAGCFLLACAVFERFTEEQGATVGTEGFLARPLWSGTRRWAGRAWPNALAWKEFNFVSGGKRMLLGRVLAILLVSAVASLVRIATGERLSLEDIGAMIAIIALFAACAEALLASARMFGGERVSQTMSVIMVLPYTPAQVLRNKVLGSSIGLLPYVATFALGGIVEGHQFVEQVSDFVTRAAFPPILAFAFLSLHLIVFTTLAQTRGESVRSLVLCFFAYSGILALMNSPLLFGPSGPPYGLLTVGLVVLILVLQRGILRRLSRHGGLG